MSVMEFILVAHAIVVGLAVAEILQGFSELFRSNTINFSYRLVLIAVWTLLLLLQVWWSIWHVSDHTVWTFAEFLLFLLPVGILYMIARLCFPLDLADVDLDAYYARVGGVIWWLVAATYASFAFLLTPFVYGSIMPAAFASQIGIVALALIASRVQSPPFQVAVIIVMTAQVLWRGFSYAIGS